MRSNDLITRATPFLQECGYCDAGLAAPCTCPSSDHRPVMLDLVREVERLRAVAWKLHRAMAGEHDKATHFLDLEDCAPCLKARDEGDPEFACDEYKAWQKAYADALCLVIGPRPEQARTDDRPKVSEAPDA